MSLNDSHYGLRLEAWRITPSCQQRGLDVAWEDAVRRLRRVYDSQLARTDDPITLTLAIHRSEGEPGPIDLTAAVVPPLPTEEGQPLLSPSKEDTDRRNG